MLRNSFFIGSLNLNASTFAAAVLWRNPRVKRPLLFYAYFRQMGSKFLHGQYTVILLKMIHQLSNICWWLCNLLEKCTSTFFPSTGCPRSNLAERIGYNFTRVLFWPHVDKVKMCFRNIHFFGKFLIFEKLLTLSIKMGKWASIFNQASWSNG